MMPAHERYSRVRGFGVLNASSLSGSPAFDRTDRRQRGIPTSLALSVPRGCDCALAAAVQHIEHLLPCGWIGIRYRGKPTRHDTSLLVGASPQRESELLESVSATVPEVVVQRANAIEIFSHAE